MKKLIRLTESDLHNIIRNTLFEALGKQSFGSSKTSINKNGTARGFQFFGGTKLNPKSGLPLYKGEPAFKKGSINVDIGGGQYDNAHEYLNNTFGATNLVFDPFSRDAEHNGSVFDQIEANGGADSVTCFNCLNVIKEPEIRSNVIAQCAQVLKPNGKAYFQVYNDRKRGKTGPRQTGEDQWQEFRDIKTYIPEIERHFKNVVKHGEYLVASEPLEWTQSAEWHMDGSGTNYRQMKKFS